MKIFPGESDECRVLGFQSPDDDGEASCRKVVFKPENSTFNDKFINPNTIHSFDKQ